jgi:hypothetical protein
MIQKEKEILKRYHINGALYIMIMVKLRISEA